MLERSDEGSQKATDDVKLLKITKTKSFLPEDVDISPRVNKFSVNI